MWVAVRLMMLMNSGVDFYRHYPKYLTLNFFVGSLGVVEAPFSLLFLWDLLPKQKHYSREILCRTYIFPHKK